MPKRVFWPAALVVMGLIFLASNLGLLPAVFWNLWPLILIIVGLGGLLLSDKEEWDAPKKRAVVAKKVAKKKAK
jgi:hypothetical protein